MGSKRHPIGVKPAGCLLFIKKILTLFGFVDFDPVL